MWTCSNCREVIEDQFDACWRCGCSREGKLNFGFLAESSTGSDGSSMQDEFARAYVCQKCQHRDAMIDRVSTPGAGLAKLVRQDFLAVSCENCGFTELYNLSVLEGRSGLQNFLRGLFGM